MTEQKTRSSARAGDDDPMPGPTSDEVREKERQNLLNHISSSHLSTMRHKVAWILNQYPDTRNSDISLQLKYWEVFESDIYNPRCIVPDDLYRLTRLTSITRERARIQNEYSLFLADTAVHAHRGQLAEDESRKAIEDKPDSPVYTVFMDESGKTSSHLIVGSVWFLNSENIIPLYNEINRLKERRHFDHEFHFAKMNPGDVETYKAMLDSFIGRGDAISMKLVLVPRSGISSVSTAIADLFYHILVKGIDHENSTRRAPLPRTLQVWKDLEEEGADKLLMANLEDKLRLTSREIYHDQLSLDSFEAVDSEGNIFLQVADILASSANRVLNRTGSRNHKDELADYLLGTLGIDPASAPNDRAGDMAVTIML